MKMEKEKFQVFRQLKNQRKKEKKMQETRKGNSFQFPLNTANSNQIDMIRLYALIHL